MWVFPSVSQQSWNNSSHRPLKETENLHVGDCQSRQTLTSAGRLCQQHPPPRLNGAVGKQGSSRDKALQISLQEEAEVRPGRVRQRSGSRTSVGKRGRRGPVTCVPAALPPSSPGHTELPSVLRRLEISALTQNPAELGLWHRRLHFHKPPHSQGAC